MQYLSDRYTVVASCNQYNICTLKVASLSDWDEIGYVVDSRVFGGEVFNSIHAAMSAIGVRRQ